MYIYAHIPVSYVSLLKKKQKKTDPPNKLARAFVPGLLYIDDSGMNISMYLISQLILGYLSGVKGQTASNKCMCTYPDW